MYQKHIHQLSLPPSESVTMLNSLEMLTDDVDDGRLSIL